MAVFPQLHTRGGTPRGGAQDSPLFVSLNPEGAPTPLPFLFHELIVAMATDEGAGCRTRRQRAPQTHPNTGGRRRGSKVPSLSGLDDGGRAPYTQSPRGGGGVQAQRSFPPAASPVGVWEDEWEKSRPRPPR